jgi:carbonic anhydrase
MAELTRRGLLKAGGATAATAAVAGVASFGGPASASAKPPPGAWNHNPASKIGPLHWGDIGFPVCGTGMSQSPVNSPARSLAPYHGPPLLLRYQSAELGVENTGHVVEVPTRTG